MNGLKFKLIFEEEEEEEILPKERVLSILQSTFASPAVVSGLLANIDIETGGSYDYLQKQHKGGPGRGLFQMEGKMLDAYNTNLEKNKLSDSAQNQIRFMKSATESNELYKLGVGNRKKIKDAFETNDPEIISDVFLNVFENPRDASQTIESRRKSSLGWYEQLKPKEYTVKPGDTLSEIAQQHNTTVEKLQKKNKIEDPNKINIGQKLDLTFLSPFKVKGAEAAQKPRLSFEEGIPTRPTPEIAPTPLTAPKPGILEPIGDLAGKIGTKEEWETRRAEIIEEAKQIPEGIKGLGTILKAAGGIIKEEVQRLPIEAKRLKRDIFGVMKPEPLLPGPRKVYSPEEKKSMVEGLQFVGNVVNEFMWRPLTGWYQSMLKEVVKRQYKTEDYVKGTAEFQSLPRAMIRGLLGLENVTGAEILEAGGIPKTEELITKHPVLAVGKEIWGATLDVLPLPILRPLGTINKFLNESKYAGAEKLALEASETIAKARYAQMGNPIDGIPWEKLPPQTKTIAIKMTGEVPIRQLGNKSIADIFYEHPGKAWAKVARKGLVGEAGMARIPFKVGDTVKLGEQTGKISKIVGTKAFLSIAGKQVSAELGKLSPTLPEIPTEPLITEAKKYKSAEEEALWRGIQKKDAIEKAVENVKKARKMLRRALRQEPDNVQNAQNTLMEAEVDFKGEANKAGLSYEKYDRLLQSTKVTQTEAQLTSIWEKAQAKPLDIKIERKGDAVGKEYHETIYAIDPKTNKKIGYIKYSYLNGESSVQMIEVKPEYRRKGIATKLLDLLQTESEKPLAILGDIATKEGQALFNKWEKAQEAPVKPIEEQKLLEFKDMLRGEGFVTFPSTPEMKKFIRGLPENIQRREAIRLYEQTFKALRRKPTLAKAEVKPTVRKVTGQVKVSELIREDIALKEVLKKEAQVGRKAFIEGREVGVEKVKTHIAEVKERAKLSEEVRTETKSLLNSIRRVDTSEMSPAQAQPINEIKEMVDFTKPTKKTFMGLVNTRTYLEANPDAELPDYVYEDLKRLEKLTREDMTLDELRSLEKTVAHHVHLEKTKDRIKVGREIRRTKEVLNSSIKEMKPAPQVKTEIVSSQKGGKMAKPGELIKDTFGIRHDHYDLVVESLSGINSTMDKVLYQGPKVGINTQLKYRQDVFAKFQTDLDMVNFMSKYRIKDIGVWLNERVKIGKFNLTRGERVALYKHSLNRNNLRHILEGGVAFKQSKTPYLAHKITGKELDATLESLTEAEREFSNPVTNLFEDQHGALNAVFYAKNGYALPKESNYYPIEVVKAALPKELEADSILEELKNKWVRIGLKKGMLEKRTKSKLPIYLNNVAYDVNKSVMNSAAYIGLELPLTNASKLLYNKTFKSMMFNRYGSQTWKEVEKGLRDIAGDWQSYTTVEQIGLNLKNQLSTAILGLNPFVMLKQPLSFALYNTYIKSQYLIQGFIDHATHPLEVMKRHKLYSPEYAERVDGGYSRDVADVFKSKAQKKLYKGKRSVKEGLMGGIKLFDLGAVNPGMQGAVLQVLDELKTGQISPEVIKALGLEGRDLTNLTPEDKMRLAYEFADWCTERTQPMFSTEHRSSLSRGSAGEKLFTMFSSFTNQALNLTRRTWREAQRTNDPKIYAKLAKVLFLLLVVNTGGVMAIDALRNRLYRRDYRKGYGEAVLDSVASYFYFVRDIERSLVSKVKRGTFTGYDISVPVLSLTDTMVDTVANGIGAFTERDYTKRRKMTWKFIDGAVGSILMLNGIPYQTPKKIITRGKREGRAPSKFKLNFGTASGFKLKF